MYLFDAEIKRDVLQVQWSFADFPHDLVHLTIKPMQKFAKVIRWIYGNEFGFPLHVGTARSILEL